MPNQLQSDFHYILQKIDMDTKPWSQRKTSHKNLEIADKQKYGVIVWNQEFFNLMTS